MKTVYLLYGGMTGTAFDWPFNFGMRGLRGQLAKLADVRVREYWWGRWEAAGNDIGRIGGLTIVVGYSGGGSRATWLSRYFPRATVDLLVAYDPSPASQCLAISPNVKQAICYYNAAPNMWFPGVGALGGGVIRRTTGMQTGIQQVTISENHLAVQNDQRLHDLTLAAIERLK